MRAPLTVRLGDTWVDELGVGYSLPEWSTSFGASAGGCDESSVTLVIPPNYRHQALKMGARYRVYSGGSVAFQGRIDEIDRLAGTIHAVGLGRQATTTLCYASNDTGAPTGVADTAVDTGIARGALAYCSRPTTIRSTAVGGDDSLNKPSYVSELLDAAQEAAGKFWTVWEDGVFRLESLPTVPSYFLFPESVDLPISYDEYASDIQLRYIHTTGVFASVFDGDPIASAAYRKEAAVDATALGEISTPEAVAHVQGILAQGKSKPGYTASVETTRWLLLGRNLQPVDLRRVRAGQLVRSFGVSLIGGVASPWVDWTIGRTKYVGGQDSIIIDPVGLVSNGSQEDVIAKVLSAAWEKKFGA